MPSLFSKLRLHRDDDHQKSETPKRYQYAKRENKAPGPLDVSTSLTTETHFSSSTLASSPTPLEQLWNTAYDQIKQKEPKLVDAYKTVLSQALGGNSSDHQPIQHKNLIEQKDISKRRHQMDLLVQVGLAKTEKEAKAKQSVGKVI